MIEIGINPVLTIGPLSLRWYGIMVALAIIVVVSWVLWKVKRGANLSYDNALTAALVGIPSGIVVSKLIHVIDQIVIAAFHPELVRSGAVIDYIHNPGLILNGEGLTIWGAVLGAALGVWIYSKFSNFKFGYFADVIAPGIILAQAIGRVGCTINGCCYGPETDLVCGVIYTHPDSYAPLGIPVHPTQVYEIIYNLIVFGILVKLSGRLKPDGSLFLIYLSLYSVWRIGIGFLREGMPFLLGLHQAQVIGIMILIIAVPILAYRTRWMKAKEH